jgi:hypothetical protein
MENACKWIVAPKKGEPFMKQISLVGAALSLIFVSLIFAGCTRCIKPEQSSGPIEDMEKTIAAQEIVNHYFYTSVTPKLRTCWDRVQGEGTIEMAFTYRKSGDRWVFESVKAIRSSLPEDQSAVAVQCMQDSAGATSFTLSEKDDGSKKFGEFVLKWTWLVPLPGEGSEIMARRAGGLTPEAGCAKCVPNYPARCQWSQSGSETDCRVDGPTQCSTSGTKCLTGIYGRAGDMILVF